jgi:GNAT superfamily N-acetyltransferase
VTVVDATSDRWDDLADLMGERGDPSRCWCQYFLGDRPYDHEGRAVNRAAFRAQVLESQVPQVPLGVLAYRDERVVGWCGIAPRSRYPRLRRAAVAQATSDEDGLWSVTCFVVRVGHRRQGVAAELLHGALDLAHRRGARVVEAYPVDAAVRPGGSSAFYWGPLSLYLRAGFTEVARPTPSRAVVRLTLDEQP